MADNTRGGSASASDPLIATDEVTYSGDTADVQLIALVHVSGSEGLEDGGRHQLTPTVRPCIGNVAHDDGRRREPGQGRRQVFSTTSREQHRRLVIRGNLRLTVRRC